MSISPFPCLKSVLLRRGNINKESIDFCTYLLSIPAVQELDHLDFSTAVTFRVGENGSGKLTLLETIAVALHYAITKAFLDNPQRMLAELFQPDS